MALYLGANTTGIEGWSTQGQQGYVLQLIFGEHTSGAPATGEIIIQWWDSAAQNVMMGQEWYEVNQYRLTIIKGMVKGPYMTVKSLAGSAVGVWTNLYTFGYPIGEDLYDTATPYGNTWGGATPLVDSSNAAFPPGEDGWLIKKVGAGYGYAANQQFSVYWPIYRGELEISAYSTAGTMQMQLYSGSGDNGQTSYQFGAGGADNHFLVYGSQRAMHSLFTAPAAAGTLYFGVRKTFKSRLG